MPQITYFVESREESQIPQQGEIISRGEYLLRKIASDECLDELKQTRSRIAIALRVDELQEDYAIQELLQEYAIQGVEADIWVNMTDKDGYWLHAGNVNDAHKNVATMMNVLDQKHIPFKNIGLDLEFPADIFVPKPSLQRWWAIKPWRFDQKQATAGMQTMIEDVLSTREHKVHTYEIPILSDYALFRRLMGIPRIALPNHPDVKRVGMVYTSLKPPVISKKTFIQNYSIGKGRIPGLGVMSADERIQPGRGDPFAGAMREVDVAEDLRFATEVSPDELFIFALNGVELMHKVRRATQSVAV